MSIMLDNHMMDQVVISGGFLRRSKITPAMVRVVATAGRENGLVSDLCCSSSSSSIGMNSDDDHDHHDDDEVESKLKNNSPFDSAVDALEQALPIRRGISKFYSGKSKSFASLGDAARSSIKDITKPENSYSRKRKNLLASSLFNDNKGRTSLLKSQGIGGGIEKRSSNTGRSTLALAVAMNNRDNNATDDESSLGGKQGSKTPSISPPLSPVPPPPWRSFSLVDLQHCAVSAKTLNSNLRSSLMGKRTKRDEVS